MDLNEPYLQMNTMNLDSGKRDYFSSMGPPETPAPPVPTYVNTNGEKGSPDSSYLNMSPKSGQVYYESASKDDQDGVQLNHINLFKKSPPASNFDKKGVRQSKKPEEMPMLKHINELVSSDSETEGTTHGNSSETRIEIPLAPIRTTTESNNYVNVPLPSGNSAGGAKIAPIVEIEDGFNSSKDAFSNPTYLGLKSFSDSKS